MYRFQLWMGSGGQSICLEIKNNSPTSHSLCCHCGLIDTQHGFSFSFRIVNDVARLAFGAQEMDEMSRSMDCVFEQSHVQDDLKLNSSVIMVSTLLTPGDI
ncbi:unnamed protein product [Musa acuminata subsp. burmannicoides]